MTPIILFNGANTSEKEGYWGQLTLIVGGHVPLIIRINGREKAFGLNKKLTHSWWNEHPGDLTETIHGKEYNWNHDKWNDVNDVKWQWLTEYIEDEVDAMRNEGILE